MPIINNYKEPDQMEIKVDQLTELGDFDVNANIPPPHVLQSDRVQLIPFIPAIHAKVFHVEWSKYPHLAQYLSRGFPTLESLLLYVEFIRQDERSLLFAIIDKTKSPSSEDSRIQNGRLAGIIGWSHGSPRTRSLEFGPVIVLPEFQRTFVSTNAIGLLLKYVLDLPAQGGLGYRRVQWTADPLNEGSLRTAEKMGFIREGLLRWTWRLPPDRKGKEMPAGRGDGEGRDSAVFALCWDDWEAGARDMVMKRMARIA